MTDFRALCTELLKAVDHYHIFNIESLNTPVVERYNALHDAANRARAALAEGERGPSDEELLELSQYHDVSYTMSDGSVVYPMQEGSDMRDSVLSFARAVLARWGSTPPRPVPVSERLPGPEDCDAEGRCWFHFLLSNDPTWTLEHHTAALCSGRTHWLPAHALPIPENADD